MVTKRREEEGHQNTEQEDGLLKEHIHGWTDSEDYWLDGKRKKIIILQYYILYVLG